MDTSTISLKELSTRAPKDLDKEETKEKTKEILEELDELQNLLFAEAKHSVLVVLQGPDASGKDGLIRDVFGSMNPQGVSVKSYGVPTEEELSHDFLWRIHKHVPEKGMVKIFNRSHYEDILVTRVHKLIDEKTAKKRMDAINDFERLLRDHNNTVILKFFLHVSADEQLERLKERQTEPRKQWKHNKNDKVEASKRDEYIACYEDCFRYCNVEPWTIVPSDQNWYKEYLVASILRDRLASLDMKYPAIE